MTPMVSCFVCYYHEILLKKGNRGFFERILRKNTQKALQGIPYRAFRQLPGRLIVELLPESPVDEIGVCLQKVVGLIYCCPAWLSSQDIGQMGQDLLGLVRDRKFETFKIQARRANKKFPLPSPEINACLGDVIRKSSGKSVRLKNPDLTCYVDIVDQDAFLYFEKLQGQGGLPVSSSGKVVVLISGGIDSPVAAYKVLKRGCKAIFVHFHSLPYTTVESLEKVRQLVSILNEYQYQSKIYMIPFAELQRQIVAFTPTATRVILYRRMMVRLAELVARRERAQALVTGDSIGQVASQTLENLRATSDACQLPVLRPLIGEDKEAIVDIARRIETFEISILPDVDCCSLFVPRHPETRAKIEKIHQIENELDVPQMIREAWQKREIEKLFSQDVLEANSNRS